MPQFKLHPMTRVPISHYFCYNFRKSWFSTCTKYLNLAIVGLIKNGRHVLDMQEEMQEVELEATDVSDMNHVTFDSNDEIFLQMLNDFDDEYVYHTFIVMFYLFQP